MGFQVSFCSRKCRRSAGGGREPGGASGRVAAGPSVLSPKQRAAEAAGSWVRARGPGLLAAARGAPARDFFLSRDEEKLPLVSHILQGLSQQSSQENCCFSMAQKPQVAPPPRFAAPAGSVSSPSAGLRSPGEGSGEIWPHHSPISRVSSSCLCPAAPCCFSGTSTLPVVAAGPEIGPFRFAFPRSCMCHVPSPSSQSFSYSLKFLPEDRKVNSDRNLGFMDGFYPVCALEERGCSGLLEDGQCSPCPVPLLWEPFLLPVESNVTLTNAHTSLQLKITPKIIHKSCLQTEPNAPSVLRGSWAFPGSCEAGGESLGFATGFLCILEEIPCSSVWVSQGVISPLLGGDLASHSSCLGGGCARVFSQTR